jgi:hypothetical protein
LSGAESRPHRAGQSIDDLCRACKAIRVHTVIAVDAEGRAARVMCDFCRSEHNYRGGGGETSDRPASSPSVSPPRSTAAALPLVSERERTAPRMSPAESGEDLELLLRRILRQELGLTAVVPADKWRGGELVLRPGKPGLQEKKWPIDSFFHKIVMVRNRLRTLEQQVNASDLPDDAKVRLQSYISGCYGTLTSFNVLFADEEDQFKGSGGD